MGWWPWVPSRAVLLLLTGSVAAGVLVSAGHLGRPLRGGLAILRLGRSPLSNEVAVVAATALAAVGALVVPADQLMGDFLALLAMAGSPAMLVALALVYRLPGQRAWGGAALTQPLVAGTCVGLLVLLVVGRATLPQGAPLLFYGLILADSLVFVLRWRQIETSLPLGEATHPAVQKLRGPFSILRVLTVDLLPVLAVFAGRPVTGAVVLALGLFLDRWLFYGLAVRHTTEAGLRRVERILEGLPAGPAILPTPPDASKP